MLPLPPGQTLTQKFPIVGEQQPAPEALDLERWRLVVAGLVAAPFALTYPQFLALPQTEFTADIHCVTGWTHLATRFTGVPLTALLARAEPRPEARFVRLIAYSARDHDTSLPRELVAETWLVHQRNGEPLTPEHGYPLRAVTPSRYFYKSLKWVHRIELLAADRLGYWERESSYHNVGDPWPGDQRFTTGSWRPEQLARFCDAVSFAPYRGPKKVLIGADLRGFRPRTRDLRELHLKRCDLRDAVLTAVDLRQANLSLCDLRGADLRGADLRQADLEGADFSGADLTAADLRGALLTATRFFTRNPDRTLLSARIADLRWDGREGNSGILEEQEAFLCGETTADLP